MISTDWGCGRSANGSYYVRTPDNTWYEFDTEAAALVYLCEQLNALMYELIRSKD